MSEENGSVILDALKAHGRLALTAYPNIPGVTRNFIHSNILKSNSIIHPLKVQLHKIKPFLTIFS